MNVTYTTQFERKERPGNTAIWEDEVVVYYVCPNCGDQEDYWSEYGHEHTLTECFQTLRDRIEKAEQHASEMEEALTASGHLVKAEPKDTVLDMDKQPLLSKYREMPTPRPVLTILVERRLNRECPWVEGSWVGTVEQIASRIVRTQAEGYEVRWNNDLVTRTVEKLRHASS